MTRGDTLRRAIGVVVGVILANVIFFLGGMVAERVYPTPPELLNPQTAEATAQRVEMAEGGGLLLVIFGSALGGFLGGMTGTKVAGGRETVVAVVIGALLALWGVYAFYVFYPQRLWFPIGLLIGFPVFCYFGCLATRSTAGWTIRKTQRRQ